MTTGASQSLAAVPLDLPGRPRIAVVHEWLTVPAGSEVVLRAILRAVPDAPLYCVLDRFPADDRRALGARDIRGTWLDRLPFVERYYRGLLPLMPSAMARLDLSAFDIVISSSHAVAKGIHPRPDALHLCYCHSPMRYAWDLETTYLEEAGLQGGVRGRVVKALLARLRDWDRRSASRVTGFMANSAFVAERIRRIYGRESTVVHPPVDTQYFTPDAGTPRGPHYLTASRLVGYKRIHAIVEAFRDLPDRQLVVIGDGPERARIAALAGPNVTLRGAVPADELRAALRGVRAFLFAAEEDFGILPVEAQACGTPVIALGRGGALETVTAQTGTFFDEATPAAIADAVRRFEAMPAPSAAACRGNAERFAEGRFEERFAAVVRGAWEAHRSPTRAHTPRLAGRGQSGSK